MKERIFKRVISVVLTAVLTTSLCACGNIGTSGEAEKNNEAAKQNVFSYEEVDLGIDMENMNIHGMSYINDRIYVLVQDYSGQYGAAVGERTAVAMVETLDETIATEEAAEEETEEKKPATEDASEEGVVVEPEEYVYTGPVYILISAKIDGTDKTEVILEEDTSEKVESSYMSRIKMSADGGVIGMKESYIEDLSDPENPIYKSVNHLMRWDAEGKLLWKRDVAEYVGEVDYFYPSQMFVMEDGMISFFSYEGIGASVDGEGNLISKIELDSAQASTMGNVIAKSDGTIYATSYNDDWTKMYISTLDLTTGTFGEKQELPGTLNNYSFYTGYNSDFTLTNSSGIYTYNLGDEAPVKIMDFINSDFPATYINDVVILDDEHMLGYYNDSTDWSMHFAYFTKVAPENVPDKITLVMGCNYLNYDVRNRVVDFNKSNPQYRIAIKDYSTYNTMEDYMAGYSQLNNDIISGQMPDILLVNSNMDIKNYISKGLLADIGELIANDEELSQKEFLTNIFDAFSVDGKLYTLVPSFSIQTMMAKKSLVGDKTGWTMDEFLEFEATLPEDAQMFGPNMLRESFIYQILTYLGNDFVDTLNGKCSFDSPEFVALLEYASRYPKEFPEDYWNNYDYTIYENMYREERAILMECYMSSISDLKYYIRGEFGEEVTFIGFPTSEGNGSIIQPSSQSFVLSAESDNIAGAWEFVRYYLTDEYQTGDNFWEFPVSKEAFLEKSKKAMEKPYWIDENGEKVEYDDTYYINGEEVIMEPFTQEEVDAICEFIYSVNKTSRFDDKIRTIINEEAQSFFEGQKSAQEVATIIQSRAQVYIDENR